MLRPSDRSPSLRSSRRSHSTESGVSFSRERNPSRHRRAGRRKRHDSSSSGNRLRSYASGSCSIERSAVPQGSPREWSSTSSSSSFLSFQGCYVSNVRRRNRSRGKRIEKVRRGTLGDRSQLRVPFLHELLELRFQGTHFFDPLAELREFGYREMPDALTRGSAFAAILEDSRELVEREADCERSSDHADALHCIFRILPIAVRQSRRPRKDALALIVTQRVA